MSRKASFLIIWILIVEICLCETIMELDLQQEDQAWTEEVVRMVKHVF